MAKKTANLQLDPAVLTELSTRITQQVLQAIEEREASRQERRDVQRSKGSGEDAAEEAEDEALLLEKQDKPSDRRRIRHPGPSQEDRQHSEPSFEESSEESTSEAESDSLSESTERKISRKKKKVNKIPDKDYLGNFRDILAFAEESEYFLAPRALRVEAKPQLFAPPTEARQAATQFTSAPPAPVTERN